MLPDTDLKGVIAAAITPVTAELKIDVARLSGHCRRLLADGCAFVSVFGTTGEGASFSTAEKVAALEGLAREGAPMKRLIPAIMTPSVDEAAGLLAATASLGCRGALILPPFYYADVPEEGIARFFEAVIERAGAPAIDVLLYHIPALSRVGFSPSLIAALIDRFGGRIAGIKDSTGDAAHGVALARRFPQLSVFTGDDRVLPTLLAAGGAGIIGGMPNAFAKDLRALYGAPEAAEAAALSDKAAKRIALIDSNGALLAMKALLARVYDDPDFARPMAPLVALPAEQANRMVGAIAETGYAVGRGVR